MPYVTPALASQIAEVQERAAANCADYLFVDTSPNSTEESLAIADRADPFMQCFVVEFPLNQRG
ncbi:MAG: hypothetical protein MRY74_14415 [Neomegalonema sp.]|nr:hypothetical protein [Neomegalonema sp.]